MAVVDSRVRSGVFTLDGKAHSCQPSSIAINPSNTSGSNTSLEVLCGDKLSDSTGAALEASLTLTAVQDFADANGLIAASWALNGKSVPFEFQPGTSAADKWVGEVTVQALEVGGTVGERLTTQATWNITKLTLPTRLGGQQVIPASTATVAITGVTAGNPGSFAPAGATLPADLAALKANSVVGDTGSAKPSAAWTTGQYVALADSTHAHWDNTAKAWAAGDAA